MPAPVSRNHDLYRIPLNSAEDADRLVLFYGLETFGAVAPNLGSRRPVLTRQAYYPLTEVPKAFYLFVPRALLQNATALEARSYILGQADAYLFAWNWRHPESRLNARGRVTEYEAEWEGRYVHSDGGHSWVHDPDRCDIDGKAAEGPRRCTAEEVSSGHHLFENRFRAYQHAVRELVNRQVMANDHFDLLAEPQHDERPLERFVRFIGPNNPPLTDEGAAAMAERLLARVPDDHPVLHDAPYRNETYLYEPIRASRAQVLSYEEVREIEQHVSGLAQAAERDGLKRIMEDDQYRSFFVSVHSREDYLPHEVVHADRIYADLPMAYFIAGLDADRPHAQAIGFYQALEHAAREMNKRGDLGNLQALLEDKRRLPDATLDALYQTTLARQPDALGLRNANGRFDRASVATHIYRRLRNPTFHAGGTGGPAERPSLPPYTTEQFSPEFQQTMHLTRELARHCVETSGRGNSTNPSNGRTSE